MKSVLYCIRHKLIRERKGVYKKNITGVFPGHKSGKMATITVSVELNWPCASSGCSILITKCFVNKEARIVRHLVAILMEGEKQSCFFGVYCQMFV